MKSDNDSMNLQYITQAVQVDLKMVGRNSLLKLDQSKGCYIKTDQPKK